VTEYTPADDLALALKLAAEADLVSLDRFQSLDLVVTTKPDRTPVSDADQAVERVIRAGIEAARPGDAILGEEYGTQGTGSRKWVIDPIDGTASFIRGVPTWSTLIALCVDEVPVVGVVSAPGIHRRWWGATGHGSFAQTAGGEPQRLAVSGVRDLADASISYNNIKGWDGAGRLDTLIELQRTAWRAQAIGDAWSYMLVAEGHTDVAGEWDMKPYDMAALWPIVTEAGGRMTSLEGHEGPWSGSTLATNGHLHDTIVRTVTGSSE